MYILRYFELFRYMVYCFFYGVVCETKSAAERESGCVLFVYGEYALKQSSSSEIVRVFNDVTGSRCVNVLTRDELSPWLFLHKFTYFVLYLLRSKRLDWISLIVCAGAAKARFDTKVIGRFLFDFNVIKLVTFCDAIGAENIFAQIVSDEDVVSYTLQHGQYRGLEEVNFSQDIEAISNFCSDYLFCWGEATVCEFEKYGIGRDRMLCVGRFMDRSNLTVVDELSSHGCFGVVFSGENSKLNNFDLVRFSELISSASGLGYYVKLHPSNSLKDYSDLFGSGFVGVIDDSNEYFKNTRFSIMAMTGFFIECIARKQIFYVCDVDGLAPVFRKFLPQLDVCSELSNLGSKELDFSALKLLFDSNEFQVEIVVSELFGVGNGIFL
ncbi:hypothetical protein [Thalassolituus oleivorans]|uniref:Uncharacterized protein n=1 Tax=Thalassolituus oleivorans MIL-1 TaxID=1298593 RepID=M5DTX6_9GAMM|nr:hypothetical protein [Thalassolituus oleivorans]CCU72969.1 hypothetical protein TOL_2570 [Thalassolituus oleivorans MIL-1]